MKQSAAINRLRREESTFVWKSFAQWSLAVCPCPCESAEGRVSEVRPHIYCRSEASARPLTSALSTRQNQGNRIINKLCFQPITKRREDISIYNSAPWSRVLGRRLWNKRPAENVTQTIVFIQWGTQSVLVTTSTICMWNVLLFYVALRCSPVPL